MKVTLLLLMTSLASCATYDPNRVYADEIGWKNCSSRVIAYDENFGQKYCRINWDEQ